MRRITDLALANVLYLDQFDTPTALAAAFTRISNASRGSSYCSLKSQITLKAEVSVLLVRGNLGSQMLVLDDKDVVLLPQSSI